MNEIEMHAINSGGLPRAEPQNDDPGAKGKISGSVKLDRDRDRHGGTDASIQAEESGTWILYQESNSLDKEKSEHSQAQAADAAPAPMSGGRTDENMERLIGLFREFLEAASDPSPGISNNNSNPPHNQRNPSGRKRLFGLKKGLSPNVGSNNRYDYEQKYPRDEFGKETAANARIWLTYLDEAEAFDRERVEGWKETVDVLLVFAGLFSGVITTFISQASTSLQQDNTQVTASLLFETVQILRAQFSGLPISKVPNSTLTPTSPFTPSTNASLVNGLWFTSLAITLSTALFAVLAKQWLYYYMASISGTANEKVRARQLRFNGFEQWKVAAIVDLLPILLHIAVGLFLTGIMILLFPLDTCIAWTIVAITSVTFTLYFISVILPIRYPECPYATSLTNYAGIFFFVLREILRWANMVLDKGFQAAWKSVNFQARRTIQHLIRYTLGVFRCLFMFIWELAGDICRGLGRHLPRIYSADFPKFAKWREDNIKQAVSNATFLDSQAVNWLYTASADRSVHRIIARSVAVHPTIADQFEENSKRELSRTLEVSRTNVQDLRYGLCLDVLTNSHSHWRLLKSISGHVAKSELEEGEYNTYLRLPMGEFGVYLLSRSNELSLDRLITGGDSVKLPLAMWCYLLKRKPWDGTIAVHILNSPSLLSNLFEFSVDPTRERVDSTGLISFDSDELGWWKFEYLFQYFRLGKPDFSSETKSYATRSRFLITLYCQLTSDHPAVVKIEERQSSLEHLFRGFTSYRNHSTVLRTSDSHFTFFKEVLCVDSFWSESMTDQARVAAVQCLGIISSEEATRLPFMDYHELSLIYQWCSRDLNEQLSIHTSRIFTVLLLPRNRHHLSAILLDDLEATSNLSTCLRNLGNHYELSEEDRVIYPLLMDFLESAKTPLFDIVLYSSSVLVQLLQLFLRLKKNPKQFFLLVKSKLDMEELDTLFTVMNDLERPDHPTDSSSRNLGSDDDVDSTLADSSYPDSEFDEDRADFDRRLRASLRMFEQIIGPSQKPFSPSGAMLDNDHDNEERAQMPGPNERQAFRSAANWMKKAFGYL